jgi:hypothetical protein
VTTALAAVGAAAALAAYPAHDGGPASAAVAGLGAVAVVVVAASIWRGWSSGVAWTLALLAAQYALALSLREGDDVVDARVPFYAAGLLVAAELAYWSIELRVRGSEGGALMLRRLAALGGLAIVSLGVGTFVVAAAATSLAPGLLWDAVGAAAAVAALALLAGLARRA